MDKTTKAPARLVADPDTWETIAERHAADRQIRYILQNLTPMRLANRWSNMISNSAKIVNIIGAHRFNTILRRTADCVDIACTGVLE